jgi:hypothetical protein
LLLDDGRYAAPKTYDEGEALSWYRDRTHALLSRHKPDCGGMKFMEPIDGRGKAPRASDSLRKRHRIEGVILQLFHEIRISTLAGPFSTVASSLHIRSAKDYLSRKDLRGIDWNTKTNYVKEAALAAVAALPNTE